MTIKLMPQRIGSITVAAFLAAIMVVAAAASATARPLGRDTPGAMPEVCEQALCLVRLRHSWASSDSRIARSRRASARAG